MIYCTAGAVRLVDNRKKTPLLTYEAHQNLSRPDEPVVDPAFVKKSRFKTEINMETILSITNRINEFQYREPSDLLKLRLYMLEAMSSFSKEYQKVNNPVLRHHIHITFYRLEELYKKTVSNIWNTPLHFKKTKQEILLTIHSFITKAEHMDTRLEYLQLNGNMAAGNRQAVA